MKKIFLLGLCIAFSLYAKGAVSTPIDSVGVEKIGDKTFIIHKVDEKETLFGISRRYQTSINDIIQANEELKQGLRMGQQIKIPFITKAAIPEGAKLHKVAPGETLFSISKTYNVSVGDIMEWNDLQGNDLSVGQSLILEGVAEVPQEKVATTPEPVVAKPETVQPPITTAPKKDEKPIAETPQPRTNQTSSSKSENESAVAAMVPGDWITHTVEAGETLFSIAKKYEAQIENIINWNALSSNNLSLGQQLKVGREPAAPSTVPVVTSSVPVIPTDEAKKGVLNVPEEEGSTEYKNVKETGLAEVIEGTGNHKKYLVLHREAPVGTIMRVRNEENDITIFARVVGKLPQTGDNQRLVIKLSKAAFDQLKAVNSRFPVEVSY
jgi:LysM repeat protein